MQDYYFVYCIASLYKCMIPAEYPTPAKTIYIPQKAQDLVYQPHKH